MKEYGKPKAAEEMIGVAREIVQLINSSNTHVNQLSAVLTKDPMLMRSILHKANAPAYGMRDRVLDLNLAIVLLGFDVLKKTVASALIQGTWRKMVNVFFTYDNFWQHSVVTALAARTLSETSGVGDPAEAFVAGLLHDIGYLVQSMNRDESHAHAAASLPPHEEAGATLVQQWELSTPITHAIRFHHTPIKFGVEEPLAAIVYTADQLSLMLNETTLHEKPELSYIDAACEILHMEKASVFSIQKESLFQTLPTVVRESISGTFADVVKNVLVNAVSELPEQERIVIALRYYDGLSFREIGQICGYDSLSVEMMHRQALQRIKNIFLPDC